MSDSAPPKSVFFVPHRWFAHSYPCNCKLGLIRLCPNAYKYTLYSDLCPCLQQLYLRFFHVARLAPVRGQYKPGMLCEYVSIVLHFAAFHFFLSVSFPLCVSLDLLVFSFFTV